MNIQNLTSARSVFFPVNHRGGWLHVELTDANGLTGWGEASHSGNDRQVEYLLQSVLPQLPAAAIDNSRLLQRLNTDLPTDKCGRTALSGIEQALFDLSCRQSESSVAQTLSPRRVADPFQVDIYANLNRMCEDRSPVTVARAARRAVDQGIRRVKFAPFDEVSVHALSVPGTDPRHLAEPGLRRLEALRDEIGSQVSLMVDCHWRFTNESLPVLVRIANDINISWLEDPVPEQTRDVATRLRDRTGAVITGGEHLLAFDEFENYVRRSGVDVLIADVKHVGGIGALHRLAELANNHGIKLAPHNPSGPISTAASAHVAAANANVELIEFAIDEIPWRGSLAPAEHLSDGKLTVHGPGIGVALDLTAVEQ